MYGIDSEGEQDSSHDYFNVEPFLSIKLDYVKECYEGDEAIGVFAAVEGGEEPYTYEWDIDGEKMPAYTEVLPVECLNPDEENPKTIKATLKITDSSSPKETRDETATITVYPLIKASIKKPSKDECYIGDPPISLKAEAKGGKKPLKYKWEITDGESTITPTDKLTTSFSCINTNADGKPKANRIKFTVTDKNNREKFETTMIRVFAALTASITGPDKLDYGKKATFSADVKGGKEPYKYDWKIGPQKSTTKNIIYSHDNIDLLKPITLTVNLNVEDAHKKTASASKQFTLNPSPFACPEKIPANKNLVSFSRQILNAKNKKQLEALGYTLKGSTTGERKIYKGNNIVGAEVRTGVGTVGYEIGQIPMRWAMHWHRHDSLGESEKNFQLSYNQYANIVKNFETRINNLFRETNNNLVDKCREMRKNGERDQNKFREIREKSKRIIDEMTKATDILGPDAAVMEKKADAETIYTVPFGGNLPEVHRKIVDTGLEGYTLNYYLDFQTKVQTDFPAEELPNIMNDLVDLSSTILKKAQQEWQTYAGKF